MYYLYTIIFWLSIIGYCNYIKDKFDIKTELTLPLVFSGISIILIFAGIFNILKLTSIILLLLGLYLLIKKYIIQKEKLTKPTTNTIIIGILLVYVTIFFSQMHYLHFDNFSHWGLIVKNLILNNSLPNFENAVIEFKAYPPGTAIFIYYFAHFFGNVEGYAIVAQNYIFIAFASSLLVLTKGKYQNIFRALILIAIFFFATCNILPYDLLVDTILSVVFISAIIFIYLYHDNLKKLLYLLIPIAIFLCSIKNTGVLLVFILCCIMLYLFIRKKEFKKGIIYCLKLGVPSLIFFYLWTTHVEYAFGRLGLSSHHAMTPNNILGHISTMELSDITRFISIYLKRFIDLKNNISNVIIIIINLLLVSLYPIYKDEKSKKKITNSLIIIDLIYLFYYFVLGLMYICSMELSGLFELAGFDRYMMTISASLIGIFIITILDLLKEHKNKIIIYSYNLLIIFFLLSFIIFYPNKDFKISNYKIFFGENGYSESYSKKFDDILKEEYINLNNNETYYVYIPIENNGNKVFHYYLARHKLNHHDVIIAATPDDIININDETLIISLENDNKFINYLKQNNLCEISQGIYQKCK